MDGGARQAERNLHQPLTLPDGTVVEPTGRAFETFFTTIARWQNDQLVDEFVLFDPQDIMIQTIGAR